MGLGGNLSFVSFQDFIQGMTSTSFETFASRAVQHEGAFEEMRSHILKMYAGVTAHAKVTSFVSEGQHVDCIAIMEQPSVFHLGIKQIEKPPMPTGGGRTKPASLSYVDSLLKQGLKDQFGNLISCAEDTIPMSRLTMDRLTQFATLKDFFAKHPSGAAVQPRGALDPRATWDPTRKSAVGYQEVINYGGNSWMELWLPVGDYSASLQRYGGGSPFQTLEGGWVVYPQRFKTTNGVTFIYWSAGTAGCYNLDCPGFVQVNHHWYLGGGWTKYATPQRRWGFRLQWKLIEGKWWLFLDGAGTYESVGYYPTSIYNGGQLSRNAHQIEFGGEVGRFVGDPWPQMGNGFFPSSSAASVTAASHFLIYYDPHNQDGGIGVDATLTPRADLPCYSVNAFPNGSLPGSGALIHYGGGGGNAC
jgi:Neprosin